MRTPQGPMGTPCGPMETPWGPMGGAMGTHGDPTGTHGGGMGAHGEPWRPHGDPWGAMGTHGDPMGTNGRAMGTQGDAWGPWGGVRAAGRVPSLLSAYGPLCYIISGTDVHALGSAIADAMENFNNSCTSTAQTKIWIPILTNESASLHESSMCFHIRCYQEL